MPVAIIPSLDFEIHGNGEGCPYALMVEPTARLLRQAERFGAKITIFAEIAEILRFREHLETTGRDDFHYRAIADQLREALALGHDVQPHIHPSYFRARLERGVWRQYVEEYDTARLPADLIRDYLARGVDLLNELLKPVRPDYRVCAFRAGNWAMKPTRVIATALLEQGITLDSSVFRGGQRDDVAQFDYRDAPSDAMPWRASLDDICKIDADSPLVEIPIYCEILPVWAFLSLNRFYRVYQSRIHSLPDAEPRAATAGALTRLARLLLERHPWKADFNQCSAAQLQGALLRAEHRFGAESGAVVPFVMIGHSKLYNAFNQRDFERFLAFVADRPERFGYARYGDFR